MHREDIEKKLKEVNKEEGTLQKVDELKSKALLTAEGLT